MPIQPKRSEIWLVNLGDIADAVGHEQANKRPCIIVQPVNPVGLAVIIPLSSQFLSKVHYAYVLLPAAPDGLNKEGYAMCHQIRTVSYKRLIKPLGTLPSRDFNRLLTVLANFIDL